MGIRSAIGKKAFSHMQKRAIRRRLEEKSQRQELRDYYGNQAEEDPYREGKLNAELEKSRSRERGSGLRARIKNRMQRWAGIESGSFRERQTMQDMYQEVSKDGAKSRSGRREAFERFQADSQDAIDGSMDDKNHNIALPKWAVDVDQNNRLAQFEDLIGGEHRQKKAARHGMDEAAPAPTLLSDMAPMEQLSSPAFDSDAELTAPVRRKKRRMDEEDLLEAIAAPVPEEPSAATGAWARRRHTPPPEELMEEMTMVPAGRQKKRRTPRDE